MPPMPSRVPAGATPEGDGIVVGDGPVRIDVYIDFLCPYCRRFELSSGAALTTLIDERRISAAYHPMNFLDAASTTHYSTRAAAAAGCASDFGRFLDYAHALFENQPPEGSAGLSEEQLGALGETAGLPAQGFINCLAEGLYLDWPPYVTALATAAGVSATPTVLVAGVAVPAETGAIVLAVDQVSAQL